jgi:arylsulfatase
LPRGLAARPVSPPAGIRSPYRELSGLPPSAAPSPLTRSYTITAEVEVREGGGEGVINTLGGRFGGYGLYLLQGKPVFTYNLLGLERFRWAASSR